MQNKLEETTRERTIENYNKSILWTNIYQWSSSEIDVFLDIVEISWTRWISRKIQNVPNMYNWKLRTGQCIKITKRTFSMKAEAKMVL